MATPAAGLQTCTLNINLFSGARTAIQIDKNVLLTLRDGNQNLVQLPHNGYFNSSTINIGGLPFFNNFGDNYAVVASADEYVQAGFYPVSVNPITQSTLDIMLMKKDAGFNFRDAIWNNLTQRYPKYAALLRAGAADEAAAADRYGQLMETRPQVLACFFNLVTSMAQLQLPVQSPLDYIRELIWDHTMQQDRFFAWADPSLIDQVIRAAAENEFSPEPGTAAFHKGATRSWKQIQFGEANLQLTFHENDRRTIGGVECVMVEPDIDYFKDPLAHALIEVVVNGLTHSLTDPRHVYVLRWIAGRHAGVPNFDPPYTLV